MWLQCVVHNIKVGWAEFFELWPHFLYVDGYIQSKEVFYLPVWKSVPCDGFQDLQKNGGKWSLVLTLVSFWVFKMIFVNSFTDGADTQNICCSSRVTKGSGSQITQLQNIECIQSEQMSSRTSHASQLNMTTANEPLNPMAPMRPKPCTKHSAVSVWDADDCSVISVDRKVVVTQGSLGPGRKVRISVR